MPRLKRGSRVLDKATRRMAGMRSISETLEFGNGLSLTNYDTRIQELQQHLSDYNTLLSSVDKMAARITSLEQDLGNYSEKMLMSAATRYGKDSVEYMQAGGKPRKRITRQSTTPTGNTPTPAIALEITMNPATNGNGTKATVN